MTLPFLFQMPPPEYGVRLLRATPGTAEGGDEQAPRAVPQEALPGPDLSPDTALDEQIQRDRETAADPDLLHPEPAEPLEPRES